MTPKRIIQRFPNGILFLAMNDLIPDNRCIINEIETTSSISAWGSKETIRQRTPSSHPRPVSIKKNDPKISIHPEIRWIALMIVHWFNNFSGFCRSSRQLSQMIGIDSIKWIKIRIVYVNPKYMWNGCGNALSMFVLVNIYPSVIWVTVIKVNTHESFLLILRNFFLRIGSTKQPRDGE